MDEPNGQRVHLVLVDPHEFTERIAVARTRLLDELLGAPMRLQLLDSFPFHPVTPRRPR